MFKGELDASVGHICVVAPFVLPKHFSNRIQLREWNTGIARSERTEMTHPNTEVTAPFSIPHRMKVTRIGSMSLDPPVELEPGWYIFEAGQFVPHNPPAEISTAAEMERATRLIQEQREAIDKLLEQRGAIKERLDLANMARACEEAHRRSAALWEPGERQEAMANWQSGWLAARAAIEKVPA